ncbi:PfkB family carbohydrate kinase [Streptomyces sp. DT171]|uniref:PfkB family carbohydrate kinase n=1 Tax=Streptomyces sp. DT171 TaxID=3416524 RepID=UPI003CF29F15
MAEPYDVITMGRIGVDIYPLQTGVPLARVETFGKFLGGSPTNVAVAAARLGRRAAVVTRTGQDAFGDYLRQELRQFGVDDRWVTPVAEYPTPVTFCEIFPPDDFPLYFYRQPKAPDLEINAPELDLDAIRAARIFWMTGTGLCAEPSRSATLTALRARSEARAPRPGQDSDAGSGSESGPGPVPDRGSGPGSGQGRRFTVFDLDWRPMFWTEGAAGTGPDDRGIGSGPGSGSGDGPDVGSGLGSGSSNGPDVGSGNGPDVGSGPGSGSGNGPGNGSGPGPGIAAPPDTAPAPVPAASAPAHSASAPPRPASAPARYREALAHATVAVGNLDECEIATGEREPYAAARALLAAGVELAVVKQGPRGVLAMHRDGTVADVPPVPVEVVNGLGAGDAFGGALCHGLLAGWDLERVVRYANAAGAIVASRLACSSAMPYAYEVEAALAEERCAAGQTVRVGRAGGPDRPDRP